MTELRSARWFSRESMETFNHRSRMAQSGFARDEYEGRPVIAILNTWSDVTPCHSHFRTRAEEVKRGVLQAGGFPLEMPALSLSEPFMKPSPLLYRNLLAMETEELLRSYPVDGAVLMGGCDKTTPGLLMGALSMDLPAVYLPAGPMLTGNARGRTLGSGTDMFRGWDDFCAGVIDAQQWEDVLAGIARSPGHCMTMGTASTMTSATEALGMALPGSASIPAVDSRHAQMAVRTGRRAVELVREGLRPSHIVTAASFDNAITTVLALGGSTNAVVHLVAMAGRAGVPLSIDRFDELAQRTPLLADVRPAGTFLMEDFFYAGGLPALLERIRHLLDTEALTVTGRTLGEETAGAEVFDDRVIRPLDDPLVGSGSLAVLRGNLCPDGAVIKPAAADPRLHRHTGPALVFDSFDEMQKATDDPDFDVDERTVLVLRNAGPQGGPGMPEWGQLPIPRALLKRGVRDMVRVSDSRMSGTSFGACVLHVAPESYVGGPLALVRTGDLIELDIPARRLHMHVDDAELARRRAEWSPPERRVSRGYAALYADHVMQADAGCDFDFLARPGVVPEPEVH